MRARRVLFLTPGVILSLLLFAAPLTAAPRKAHTVYLGAFKKVPYSQAGDPAGAQPGETELKIRALLVDGVVKEWTTGDAHDVTDRSFAVRRALRINDDLPGEKPASAQPHWVWQRGPWLLVDRATGHLAPLKLPEYSPAISQVAWFRDYAAYCGITASGKSLYAVVAQLAARKPVVAKKLAALDPTHPQPQTPLCAPAEWQRDPIRVTFHPPGEAPKTFDIVPGSALLVEGGADDDQPSPTPAPQLK